MNFAEKLKSLRKQGGFSQEKLAERLGVSRQAITKWENNSGTPDIENLIAISALFDISIDELLSCEKRQTKHPDYLFESVTEYDIDSPKRYDIKLGGARLVRVSGYNGEKMRVCLASNKLSSLQSDIKLKIDDKRDRLDLDLSRRNGMTEASLKEALYISVYLPDKYISNIELAVNSKGIELSSLVCEQLELDIKSSELLINDFNGTIEVNCNLDMNIECQGLNGGLEINQISSTSRLVLPQDFSFSADVKGIANSISYEKDEKGCDDFSVSDAQNRIQLNGLKSELVIVRKDDK